MLAWVHSNHLVNNIKTDLEITDKLTKEWLKLKVLNIGIEVRTSVLAKREDCQRNKNLLNQLKIYNLKIKRFIRLQIIPMIIVILTRVTDRPAQAKISRGKRNRSRRASSSCPRRMQTAHQCLHKK